MAARCFGRYAAAAPWIASVGSVEGRPAVLLRRPLQGPGNVGSFLLLVWQAGRIAGIRDYLFAPYVPEGAVVQALAVSEPG